MGDSQSLSFDVGSFVALVKLPWPWPPTKPMPIFQTTLRDGELRIFANPAGTLSAQLLRGSQFVEVVSCPIKMEAPLGETIGLSWEYPHMDVYMGGIAIASTRNQNIAQGFEVLPRSFGRKVNYAKESVAAITKRRDTFRGTHPKPNRRHGGKEYIFQHLHGELAQLRDLIQLIHRGGAHHVSGLAARLRLLVAGKPLALLQQCAAAIDEPLTVYVGPQQTINRKHPLLPDRAVILMTSTAPTHVISNPIDLDVWLKLPAIWINPKIFTNADVLNDIGNTIGAHIDINIEPTVDALRELGSPFGVSEQVNFLTQYLCMTGEIMAHLCEFILEREGATGAKD